MYRLRSVVRWYVDPISTQIHPSGNPDLCLTGLVDGSMHLWPCRPCAVGSEARRVSRSYDPADVDATSAFRFGLDDNELLNATALVDPETVVSLPTLSPSAVFMLETPETEGTSIGLLLDDNKCWTANQTTALTTSYTSGCVLSKWLSTTRPTQSPYGLTVCAHFQ